MRLMKSIIAFATAVGFAASAHAAGETVVVLGGGKSGLPLVKILQDQGYKVRLSVRDKTKAQPMDGVEIVSADVTQPDTLPSMLKDAAYVISTIGAGGVEPPNNAESVDYQGIVNLTDAAKAANIKHLVLMSSIGAGDANPETFLNKRFGMVLMWKGKGEDYLRQSGQSYTIVRPGGLQECEPGKTGLKLDKANSGLMGRICRADVGLVMADALTNADAAGKTVETISDAAGAPDAWRKLWSGIPKD